MSSVILLDEIHRRLETHTKHRWKAVVPTETHRKLEATQIGGCADEFCPERDVADAGVARAAPILTGVSGRKAEIALCMHLERF